MTKSVKHVSKAVKMSMKALHSSKKAIEKDVSAFVKSGTLTATQGKKLAKNIMSEANKQRMKLQSLVSKIVKTELKKSSPYVKTNLKKGAALSIKGMQVSAGKAAMIADNIAHKLMASLEKKPAKKTARKKPKRKRAKAKPTKKRTRAKPRKADRKQSRRRSKR